MARLPEPGGDAGNWGEILNNFLAVSLSDNGLIKNDTVGAGQLRQNAVMASAIGNAQITTSKIADGAVSKVKLQGVGQADGLATLDVNSIIYENQLPSRLSDAQISSKIESELPYRHLASFTHPGETLALDGVNYGDNSAILQRAIDEMALSDSSWAVMLPNGSLRLKTSGSVNSANYGVRVKSRTRILGSSQLSSKIISDVNSTPLFAAYGGTLTDVEIGNLTIDCESQYQEKNGAPEYTTQLKAMFMQDIIRPRFHDLTIRGSWGTSIGCDALVDYAINRITIYNPGRGIGVSGIDPFLASGGSGIGIGTGKYRDEAGTISDVIVHNAGRVALFYEKQTQYSNLSRGHVARNIVSIGSWTALHDCGCDGLVAEITSIGDQHGLLLDGTYLEPHAGINGDVTMHVDGALKAGVLFGAMPEGKYTVRGNIIRSKAGVLTKASAKVGPNVQVYVDTKENIDAGVYIFSTTTVKALSICGRHENNGQGTSSQRSGVIIDSSTEMLDINVVARDTQNTRTQQYGVELRGSGTATAAAIRGDVRGNAVGGYLSSQTVTGDSLFSLAGATTSGPSHLTATPGGSGELVVSWDAPFPSSDVTDYQVEYRQGTTGSWIVWAHSASTATTTRITGLINRQEYQIRVAAIRTTTIGDYTAGPITSIPVAEAIISDTFIRANAATLGSTDGGSLGSLAWEYTNNTSWKIQSNYARPGSGGLSIARVNTTMSSYSVEAVVADLNAASGSRQADVIFRFADESNYWMVTPRIDSSLSIWGIQKRVAGSNTIVAKFTDTSIANGDRVRIDVTAADIKVYINNVLKGTYNDTTHSTATRVGMRGSFTGDPVSKFGTALNNEPGFRVYAG